MKMRAYASFDAFLKDQTAKNQKIIRALRTFVKKVEPGLHEAVKWGNGCWIGEHGPVAYVYSDAGYVQFGFFNGAALKAPKGLLEGKGRYVRHIKVHDQSEIDPRTFATLLRQAAKSPLAPRTAHFQQLRVRRRLRCGEPVHRRRHQQSRVREARTADRR